MVFSEAQPYHDHHIMMQIQLRQNTILKSKEEIDLDSGALVLSSTLSFKSKYLVSNQ